jgi:hypothetical protein
MNVEDSLGLENAGVALGHLMLNRDRAFDRRNDGRKFQQHAVAANDQPTTSRPPDSFGSFTTITLSAQKGLAFRCASSIVSLSDVARMARG